MVAADCLPVGKSMLAAEGTIHGDVGTAEEGDREPALNGRDSSKGPAAEQRVLPPLAELEGRRPQPGGDEGMTAIPVRAAALGSEIERVGDGGAQVVRRARVDGLGQRVGGSH